MNRAVSQIAYLEHFERVIYFASVVDVETNRYFLLAYEIELLSSIKIYLIVDFRSLVLVV